jgi:hypothetical protein
MSLNIDVCRNSANGGCDYDSDRQRNYNSLENRFLQNHNGTNGYNVQDFYLSGQRTYVTPNGLNPRDLYSYGQTGNCNANYSVSTSRSSTSFDPFSVPYPDVSKPHRKTWNENGCIRILKVGVVAAIALVALNVIFGQSYSSSSLPLYNPEEYDDIQDFTMQNYAINNQGVNQNSYGNPQWNDQMNNQNNFMNREQGYNQGINQNSYENLQWNGQMNNQNNFMNREQRYNQGINQNSYGNLQWNGQMNSQNNFMNREQGYNQEGAPGYFANSGQGSDSGSYVSDQEKNRQDGFARSHRWEDLGNPPTI